MSSTPRLAITLGDPAGIGPEVVLKALANPSLTQTCEITLVGSRAVLHQTHEQLLNHPQSQSLKFANPADFPILESELEPPDVIQPGQGNAATGAASFAYLEQAIARTLAGEFQGIVTGPIAKTLWQAAGQDYPGQTERLAERAGVQKFAMLFVARSPHSDWILRTLLATTHIPLAQVSQHLTPRRLTEKLALLIACLQEDFGLKHPRIAIAGLNPHSGENGQLGPEERDWLIPWIAQMGQDYPQIQLDGPVPPDTLWVKPGQVWFGTQTQAQGHDAYLALYHDQGLIPVKLMAFDRAVNTTIGLPFVRTSPDHGTAFDIAGQGIADASSMTAAIQLAVELALQRFGRSLV
ncbi:MAG: 4-hydroxythreonine-4-phosphate dehydrogenase PdxA [Oscillatoriales cyanobacterium RM2_1_1]|nr:4-hydroxythreonine-4-phosphate dehydrogenase PdxA [Oscillatoriales cyanobacterium SM2_3_0]NJO45831.1 4-hydroxythreonine-4-phosphate dehydrogenase PdxA [Oscillatoriales cyanobacterium RM2_1_1]